ncbi:MULTISPECIES: LLM class flavin-dependent oxidoreductase [Rhizobium]|jgi:FMN-dependent oxidoreductase (nitrilotriacetate monooxygenase family)|uniref:Putative monooxygenase YxeK n=1 Tax=Rhizobium leguminosarum TaxID=384 RepID=A0A2K9ZCX5_RHILE|nr:MULTISPECIES: LLM class flavin-dependent oxidoreductase [Rhizobium]AUW46094.1 putative monooxygenase YxeK [Rhizobium leguminosarum]MBY4593534.1 LLM class flavin-dependent oxidoreductase [Rhizobium redzepovicii]MBY5461189.1 LLM class flavin-dependent oxidoreductase [Rhizobium leguminosarum]MBY5919638.1 LLM class flavin-dependent oxidoreductase [Rhizobium leguminosarum]NKJ94611.1 NtaA/DmoA family FMN-dependent monooxygenase [Rhizobium leguminosarum bv. viciae]
MGRRKDKIKLGAFLLFTGHHVAAWRHPQASVGTDFEDYFELAKLAEAAKFDAIFFADGVAARLKDVEAASRKAHSGVYPFEPITLLSALSSVTSNIGLIATASTSFSDPYNLARQFGSLDRLSGGRAGWNLVTSSDPEAAYNFGHEAQILHADRYDRAEEFADVVLGLWDSWDDDAFIRDRESGRYFDPVRLHRLNHKGRHFKVRGPLNIPRSPQGRPVLVQAGASGPGKELAARTAEAIFAAHITLDEAKTFYADVKGKLGTYGRSPDDLKILPGIFPVVGRSETEAQEKFEALQELIQPQVGLNLLSQLSGVDLSPYPLDGPIPSDLPVTNAGKSRQELVLDLARRENLTIRQLYLRIAGARGHWQVVGTPSQIADVMEERFENYGADGFNIMAPMMPGGLADFIELVVPELRRRGLFRTEYEGTTLRENLGLKRPVNRFAVNNAAAAE